jgi:hypothetical protein
MMMANYSLDAFLFAHQVNIDRYRRIFKTNLTNEERRFVERRIAEEEEAIKQLADATSH